MPSSIVHFICRCRTMRDKISVKKQFYMIAAILLSCCIALGVFAYYNARQLLVDKNVGYAMNSGIKYAYDMNNLISRIYNIVGLMQEDNSLSALLQDPHSSEAVDNIKRISTDTSTYMATSTDIVDIAISSDSICWSSLYRSDKLDEFTSLLGDSKGIVCLGMDDQRLNYSDSDVPYLVFGCNLFGASGHKKLGALFISVNMQHTTIEGVNGLTDQDPSLYYFIGNENFILYLFNTNNDTTLRIEEQIGQIQTSFQKNAVTPTVIETLDYSYIYSYVQDTKLYIICAIDKAMIRNELASTKYLIISIATLFIIFIFVIFSILMQNIVAPINQFYKHMNKIKNGDRREMHKAVELSGCQELHDLSCEFNGMIAQITALDQQLVKTMSTLYESDIQKKNAEIAYLRSQINPHFLYNTLESIKGIALENNVMEIADIAVAMGKIYRYSIKGSNTVTLQQEIDVADAYLRIQKMRFKGRFDVIYNIPDDVKSLYVIKMLLQPLTENAVVHGLENSQSYGTLYAGAQICDSILLITVMDDGGGIPCDKLAELNSLLENGEGSEKYVGLVNTAQRIKLYYGVEYGLTIESPNQQGTKVLIRLPIREKDDMIPETTPED